MKLRLLASIVISLVLFLAARGCQTEARGYTTVMPQVVRLMNADGFCSAFLIERNTYLTARHCFRAGIKHPTIQRNDRSVVAVQAVVLGDLDYAIVTAPSDDTDPLQAQIVEPEGGMAVSHVGHALGGPQAIRFGFLIYSAPMELGAVGDAYPGDSGGPMLDAQGRVVGIVIKTSQPVPLFYALPISRVLGAVYGRGSK